MSERYTMGKYVLVTLALIIGINYIINITAWYFGLMSSVIESTETAIGSAGKLTEFVDFLKQLFTWYVYIFTNDIQLVVLFFIALIYEALESEWI